MLRARRWGLVGLVFALSGAILLPEAQAQEGAGRGVQTAAVVTPPGPEGLVGRPPAAEAPSVAELQAAVDAVLASANLGAARVGFFAMDVDSREVLYARNAEASLNPASNVKLITAAAVLDQLGPNHTFATRLLADRLEGNAVRGNLYVRGDGEAQLAFSDVMGWAGRLRQAGIERIEGDLVMDDSRFGASYLPPGYEQKNTDAYYRSAIGAVSINYNAVEVVVEPGLAVGDPVRVRLDPPNRYVEVVNTARTVGGRVSKLLASARAKGQITVLDIGGSLGVNASSVAVRKRIENPPLFTGGVVSTALSMVGIELKGRVRVGQVPAQATELFAHRSQPMWHLVSGMNKWSNNFMAEQMFLALAAGTGQVSWEASRGRAAAFLEQVGFSADSYKLHNGSGLYEGNAFSARQLVELLRYMRAHRYGPEFVASLAIAGVDGTLKDRFKGTELAGNLRGKTGTLSAVLSLAGYVRTRSGRTVAFAIMLNDTPKDAAQYRGTLDAAMQKFGEWGG